MRPRSPLYVCLVAGALAACGEGSPSSDARPADAARSRETGPAADAAPLSADVAAAQHDLGPPLAPDGPPVFVDLLAMVVTDAAEPGDAAPPADAAPPDVNVVTVPPLDASPPACPADAGGTLAAAFVEEDIPDGTKLKPGTAFTKRWRLRNTGTATWSAGCGFALRHVGQELLDAPAEVPVPAEVHPGDTVDLRVPMTAPPAPGTYRGDWRMSRQGTPFGDQVWVLIKVSACATAADCVSARWPVCDAGTCKPPACTGPADCTDPATPHCDNGSCVECIIDAHCGNSSSKCVAGECACGVAGKPTKFAWPAPETLAYCQKFGNPITYQPCGFHTGIDVCGSFGEPLLAIAAGKVVHVGPLWLDGPTVGRGPHSIVIQHSPNFYSTYGHNQTAAVQEGDCVEIGQYLGEMGSLGYSAGPHLHYELVEGTPFTGQWDLPFNNACAHYVDPLQLKYYLYPAP